MNKKGAAMVEAAVVFPLVILAVISVICILIFLYNGVEMQCKMHMALRAEAGEVTETVNYIQQPDFVAPITRKGQHKLETKSQLKMGKRGLLFGGAKLFQETCYLSNGTDQVRKRDLIYEKMQNE